jgi:hypothetical protein
VYKPARYILQQLLDIEDNNLGNLGKKNEKNAGTI